MANDSWSVVLGDFTRWIEAGVGGRWASVVVNVDWWRVGDSGYGIVAVGMDDVVMVAVVAGQRTMQKGHVWPRRQRAAPGPGRRDRCRGRGRPRRGSRRTTGAARPHPRRRRCAKVHSTESVCNFEVR